MATLKAFRRIANEFPESKLHMAGLGPLFEQCVTLVKSQGISSQAEFLRVIDHATVANEMSMARAFVQHSVTTEDGDSEGTPVTIYRGGGVWFVYRVYSAHRNNGCS